MLQSKLFGKTVKEPPKDEVSVNAILLSRGGFVDKLTAGVYTYLPLGLRVLRKIQQIVRDEMNAIEGQEILMPALLPKDNWVKSGRWSDPGKEVMFQFEGRAGKEFGLGWTHEEIVTPLVKKFTSSYKDLPVYLYQIQDKFRNEPRAKSGLMRGLEFSMKDLYSFHRDADDLAKYYQEALAAYQKIFLRCGLEALVTEASGGSFSKYSHEFQVLTEFGEDTIFYCASCHYAQNKEVAEIKGGDNCPKCGGNILEGKAIEVGNIFSLKTKYSEPFNLEYTDVDGKVKPVMMGCYGIGPSRVMGSIVEIHHDDKGIIWPASVAPFAVHLLQIGTDEPVAAKAKKIYNELLEAGVDVLFDDRSEASAGQKFADADLIGIPLRLVISVKAGDKIEVKKRSEAKIELMTLAQVKKIINV
ncbi:MAG: His/Gly/Thr/Pro-type tRNA ligase C-terminal domain-containing protein [Patescibacteria group bacterium]|nr:His/Gly/Thr/Pro-type tRNA ligase C-terminal domain-containing protein [Patescibacteria group bacterium]